MPADNLRGRSGSGDGRTSAESNCRLLGPDLLFYPLCLRCFVVIDLKIEEFKPEFAGKMNFYLSAIDEQMQYPNDAPTIGISSASSVAKSSWSTPCEIPQNR
jgi:hypothetical protein